MSSGVTVSAEAKITYEELKKNQKYRYIIYHIEGDDEKVVEVESTGPRDATYDDFLEDLDRCKSQCRYCVIDFPTNIAVEGTADTTVSVDRLILMRWYPEEAKVKQKMLYSTSYETLEKTFTDFYKYIQVSEYEEANQAAIENILSKNSDSKDKDSRDNMPWFKGLKIHKDGEKIKGDALLEALDMMESSSDGEYGVSLKDLTLREFLEFLEDKAISSVKNHFRDWEEKEINFLKEAGIYDHLK
ncbi:cofilin/actin-depolymerizing factor homolog [Brevipalpus obovatus]|uniref:cofilin/actin-depolymerizing factor homolog n=1 Tax=Brevipalpus obovatus TaxID=246614 RepID=UPI003D9FA8BB